MTRRSQNPTDFIGRPVWAEVSLSALQQNLQAIRDYVNPASEKRKTPRKVLSIVKGNAYGHGGAPTAKALEKFGSDWFGVASSGEGIEIRKVGVHTPILVLGGFWQGEEELLIQHNLTPAIHRCEQLLTFEAAAAKLGKKHIAIHLKVDTGMNRLGIKPSDADCFAGQLAKCKHLELTGVFTHFASSEVLTDTPVGRQTQEQLDRFHSTVDRLRSHGIDPGILHLANSAAIAARPETWADMVRPGAILYGYYQSFDPPEKKKEVMGQMPLQPSLSLRARIIALRDLAPGQSVGYAARFISKRPSRIAVINAGYADGVVRALTNKGQAVVNGRRVPLVGTISMDLTTLDVTDVPDAKLGDVVSIFGADGDEEIQVSDVAASINTVTSDLLCALGRRVPRFYL